jgi:hypothetical protein
MRILILFMIIFVLNQNICDSGDYDTTCIVNRRRQIQESLQIKAKGKLTFLGKCSFKNQVKEV